MARIPLLSEESVKMTIQLDMYAKAHFSYASGIKKGPRLVILASLPAVSTIVKTLLLKYFKKTLQNRLIGLGPSSRYKPNP